LIGCPKCVAGQIAFWGYFFQGSYNFFEHLSFITITILITAILTQILNKLFLWN
jgi:hypothetical protein